MLSSEAPSPLGMGLGSGQAGMAVGGGGGASRGRATAFGGNEPEAERLRAADSIADPRSGVDVWLRSNARAFSLFLSICSASSVA